MVLPYDETTHSDDARAIVETRIAEEAERRSGTLDLRGLGLGVLPEALRSLTALQSLDCSGTQITDLTPLTGLTALQSLDCSGTQVALERASWAEVSLVPAVLAKMEEGCDLLREVRDMMRSVIPTGRNTYRPV